MKAVQQRPLTLLDGPELFIGKGEVFDEIWHVHLSSCLEVLFEHSLRLAHVPVSSGEEATALMTSVRGHLN